ncbi:hypothetical protein MEQU1_002598 [Malassezia equina]|uniref:Uncharacterized protein n=1 Tax=Malassezia equina TaxID=1381935 RepID=A0AAF0IZE4_9BASI|nr:hypothetical protein MEQU1_002598 [Malassezia equina]
MSNYVYIPDDDEKPEESEPTEETDVSYPTEMTSNMSSTSASEMMPLSYQEDASIPEPCEPQVELEVRIDDAGSQHEDIEENES